MSESTQPAVPGVGTILVEQIRAVGMAIQREVLGAVILSTALVIVAILLLPLYDNWAIQPSVDMSLLALWTGLILPVFVWKGERRRDVSHLWTLPVPHSRHALLKVTAGWGWLMVLVVFAVLALTALGVFGGPRLGVEEVRWVLGDGPAEATRTGPPGTYDVPWSTPAWQWLVPFTLATIAYMVGSTLILATDRPFHWAAGIFLVFALLAAIAESEAPGGRALADATERLLFASGFDLVLTSGEETRHTWLAVEGGPRVKVWPMLPSFGRWSVATLAWAGAALVALFAVAKRGREGLGPPR